MDLDTQILSRIQFAFTISFHIIFPAFTIGLASWLAVVELLWLRTGRAVYLRLARFWTKVFAVSFGLGVVSGVVMSYQFGTNWSRFSDATGNVLGPLLTYEVLTAFFLEASFLGVMLFGWNRVGPKLHFLATCMVALGTLISSFWILSANSWMHTPAGHVLRDGIFYVESWWEVIFNPSFPYRLVHMVLAAFLTTSLVIAGAAGYYLRRGRFAEEARVMLRMAVGFLIVVVPFQIVAGDLHGLNTLQHQPAKVAAMEGHWEAEITGAPLILFGWPDAAAETTRWAVEIPRLGSLILTHEWDGAVQGLRAFPPEDRPPAAVIFWTFRIMVAIGFLMLAFAVAGVVLWLRGRLFARRWYQLWAMGMMPLGFVAILAGWFTTEIGRQPFVVYGIMRTADAYTLQPAGPVAATLLGFLVVYAFVFGAGTYYILRLLGRGPDAAAPPSAPETAGRPARPFSAAIEQPDLPQEGRG